MAIPKAKSAIEVPDHDVEKKALVNSFREGKNEKKLRIKPIECCNDFVAIMPIVIEAGIVLPETAYTNEGVVVGVGPGVVSGQVRVPSQLSIGDVVIYNSKSSLTQIQPDDGAYKGKTILIISERSVFCITRKVDYELYA